MPCMPQPEVYIGGVDKLYDGDTLTNDGTRSFLQQFIDRFATWVERNAD